VTVLGLALAMLGPMALAAAGKRWNHGRAQLGESLVLEALYLALVAGVLWLATSVQGLTAAELGFRPPSWQALVWGALLAVFFIRVYGPLVWRALVRLGLGTFDSGLSRLDGLPLWYLALAVAIGGTAEEILYRGYAIATVQSLTGSVWLAALIPIAVFAVAHVPFWGWAPALSTALAGGVATAFYLWQGDLLPLAISHVASDFVGIVLSRRAVRLQNAS
jgi:membrane protease YdiL (CAAX protease family)